MDIYDEDTILIAINEINTLKTDVEQFIMTGKCSDYSNYKEMCGRIRAYTECSQIAKDCLNKIRNS